PPAPGSPDGTAPPALSGSRRQPPPHAWRRGIRRGRESSWWPWRSAWRPPQSGASGRWWPRCQNRSRSHLPERPPLSQ
ncbi:RNA-binding protein KhpA, partial [Dysosmobacter welbionis]